MEQEYNMRQQGSEMLTAGDLIDSQEQIKHLSFRYVVISVKIVSPGPLTYIFRS
jgi:hypothetical protein